MAGAMISRMLTVLVMLAALAVPSLAEAGSCYSSCYSNSYVAPSYGYSYPTYSYYPSYSTNYYAPSYTYTWSDPGWSGGRYYPAGYYYWDGYRYYLKGYGVFYGYATAPAGYATPSVDYTNSTATNYTDLGWRTKLLDIAKQRDVYELNIRKNAVDQAAFLQGVQALGLGGNFNIQGYGQNVAYPAYGVGYVNQAALGSYGISGNTVYGTTYQQQNSQSYGQVDVNAMNQAAWRAVDHAQEYTKEAHGGTLALNNAINQGALDVAQTLARGQATLQASAAGANLYRSTAPPPSSNSTVTTITQGTGTTGGVGTGYQQPAPGQPSSTNLMPRASDGNEGAAGPLGKERFLAMFGAADSCGKCHSGSDPKGKFNIAAYPEFNGQQKLAVWERVLSKDPKRVMPPPDSGVAPLTEQGKFLLIVN